VLWWWRGEFFRMLLLLLLWRRRRSFALRRFILQRVVQGLRGRRGRFVVGVGTIAGGVVLRTLFLFAKVSIGQTSRI
jgi:hypothetical protein